MASKGPSYDPELLRGNTDSMLLFLIEQQGPSYGYGLIKEVESRSRGYFRFREGTVYPALRKLENDGLVRGELKRLANGQERRYYSITAKGRKLLARKLAVWSTFTSAMGLVLKPARQ
jgi:PadR family transcriptional regulator PadR